MLCLHVKKSILCFIHLKNERVAVHILKYIKIQKYKKYYIFSVRVIKILHYIIYEVRIVYTFDCCVSYTLNL